MGNPSNLFPDSFVPTPKQLFFSKSDQNDLRLGDLVNQSDNFRFVIGGYPDDEGVKNNGGRVGTADGPNSIRDRFYRMTPAWNTTNFSLRDVGNLNVSNFQLKDRHEACYEMAYTHLCNGKKWIGLGGGHDYGYSDGKAFLEHVLKGTPRPLIINYDAHLDVRPLTEEISSGTPFFRLLQNYPDQFDFIEIGIQDFCNSQKHLEWVEQRNGHVLTMDRIRKQNGILSALESLEVLRDLKRPCFISVDIDGFCSELAMGCSQSWPGGFTYVDFMNSFEWLCYNFNVSTLGIYEVAPNLDSDQRTAKLAAEIMYQFISYEIKNG